MATLTLRKKPAPERVPIRATLDHVTIGRVAELEIRAAAGDERASYVLSGLEQIGRHIVDQVAECSECGAPIGAPELLACASILVIKDADKLGIEGITAPFLCAMSFCRGCIPVGEAQANEIASMLARKAISTALPMFRMPEAEHQA